LLGALSKTLQFTIFFIIKNFIFMCDMCENAFEELKRVLTNPPLLIYPDWEKGNFNLTTDASQYAIGAVLSQGELPADKLNSC
jgi:hypothetical protein